MRAWVAAWMGVRFPTYIPVLMGTLSEGKCDVLSAYPYLEA